MHGIRRVLVFCTLTTVLPTMLLVIPLYLRHSFYANVAYAVTESDILEISDGISTIFCSKHSLQMNGSFNAFQMAHRPEVTSYRKHIRLKKSMNLPDDTLEYWGFYLLKGATVALSVCSRFQGASILVVKGERNLRTCSMLEHNNNKGHATGVFLPEADHQVKVIFESNTHEVDHKAPVIREEENIFIHSTPSNRFKKYTDESYIASETKRADVENTSTVASTNAFEASTEAAVDETKLEALFRTAESYVQRHMESEHAKRNGTTRRLRHAKRRIHRVEMEKKRKQREKEMYESRLKDLLQRHAKDDESVKKSNYIEVDSDKNRRELVSRLKTELNNARDSEEDNAASLKTEAESKLLNLRTKRNQDPVKPPSLLDQGIKHGGNADRNATYLDEESSVSSFESSLFDCYEGAILVAQEFEPSDKCVNVSYLVTGKHMETRHDVSEDGYYYYIFYSDNDFVSNDIHALFDIYKPTFQYENVTKSCINQTDCTFSLDMLSPERVIVEIPTKDGIDHEQDEVHLLVSICHPRMGTYVIFPIAVLFLVLTCAFM